MKTLPLAPSFILALFVTGCITNKDVGLESETSDESSSSAGTATASGTSGSASGSESATTMGSISGTASESDSETATDDTGIISGTGSASDTALTGSDTGDGSSSSSGGDVSVEQQICESQNGTWDSSSCGHYECGVPPDCAAVIPGCDCGPFATFTKLGCTPLIECVSQFDCGPEITCTAGAEYCEVFVPGVKGAPTSYACQDTPDACLGGYDCACLLAEGAIGEEADCMAAGDGTVTITLYGA